MVCIASCFDAIAGPEAGASPETGDGPVATWFQPHAVHSRTVRVRCFTCVDAAALEYHPYDRMTIRTK